MFCNKCGNQLPDGVAFCNKCGNQLKPQQTTSVNQSAGVAPQAQAQSYANANTVGTAVAPQGVTTTKSKITTAGIVGRIAAIIAAICMFLPWVSIPSLNTLSGYAAQLGLGSSRNYDYTMIGLGEPLKKLSSLIGNNSLNGLYLFFMILWVVVLIILAIGIITSFTGKAKGGLLAVGCFLACALAIVWVLFVAVFNNSNHFEVLSVAMGCYATVVLSLLAFIFVLVGRQKS